jgi:hypothetical protein
MRDMALDVGDIRIVLALSAGMMWRTSERLLNGSHDLWHICRDLVSGCRNLVSGCRIFDSGRRDVVSGGRDLVCVSHLRH